MLVTASPLHKVFQLADIARPLVVEEQRFGFFGKRQLSMVLAAVKPQEHACEGQNVRLAVAQRRNGDHRHLEPVIEITAEFPARDGAFEILVGGGDDADVDRFGVVEPTRMISQS